MAAVFPYGYSNRENFLSHADVVNMAFIKTGLEDRALYVFSSFHYIIFKRQVFNILGLTLTLYQWTWTSLFFYWYWKKKKQNYFLLVAALWRWEEKGLWVALRLSCHSSIITFESTWYKSRLPEPHFGGRIAVRRKGEGCAALTKSC